LNVSAYSFNQTYPPRRGSIDEQADPAASIHHIARIPLSSLVFQFVKLKKYGALGYWKWPLKCSQTGVSPVAYCQKKQNFCAENHCSQLNQ
jgi:hypothetical protein